MRRWGLTDPVEIWERVQLTLVVFIENEMHLNPGLERYLQREQFQPCQEFEVQEVTITLLRPNCEPSTPDD